MKKTQNFIETRIQIKNCLFSLNREACEALFLLSFLIAVWWAIGFCMVWVTFVWTSLLLWIRFTGRTCNFIIDVTHDGVRFRWCCTWHWFRSWRLMPIPIGNELFLWWLHCTLLFIQFMGYFGTVLNSCLASILPNFIHAIYTHTHTHTSKHSNMLQIVQKLEHVKTNIFYWNLTFWRDENWRPIYRIEMLNWFKIPMPLKWLWKNWTHEHTTNRWIFFKVSFTVQTLWTFNLNLLKQYLLSFRDFFYAFWHESSSYNNIYFPLVLTLTHTHKHKEKCWHNAAISREQNTIFCTGNAM